MHSIELTRAANARAKTAANLLGVTLESYVRGLVEEYGSGEAHPVTHGRERRQFQRVKLRVSDEDWEAARRRAGIEGATLTEVVVGLLEGK